MLLLPVAESQRPQLAEQNAGIGGGRPDEAAGLSACDRCNRNVVDGQRS